MVVFIIIIEVGFAKLEIEYNELKVGESLSYELQNKLITITNDNERL